MSLTRSLLPIFIFESTVYDRTTCPVIHAIFINFPQHVASVEGFGLLSQEVRILKNNLICSEDDAVGEVWS